MWHANRPPGRLSRSAPAAGRLNDPSSRFLEQLESRVLFDVTTDILSGEAGSDDVIDVLLNDTATQDTQSTPTESGAVVETTTTTTTTATTTTTDTTTSTSGSTSRTATRSPTRLTSEPIIVAASTTTEAGTPAPRPPTRSPADFRYVLIPGTGWTGASAPDLTIQNIDMTQAGFDARAIARWDVVPYQTFDGIFNVGVVAFHMNGIKEVDFSVNGGAWTPVRSMTLNPQTNVYEYTATLRASDFADGQVEVRAIAYPNNGVARVLGGSTLTANGENSLFLSSNGNHTLPSLARYVSPTGSDTTGDGSEANPFASIMRAAKAIQTANGTGNADGGIVYLEAGTHVLGTYAAPLTVTISRWLTITTAPGLTKANVTLNGSATSDGIRTKLVHLKDLTINPQIRSQSTLEDYLWSDNCRFIGSGRTIDVSWLNGWSKHYDTDCEVSDSRDGLVAAEISRNTVVHDIGSDAFSNSGLVLNCTASRIDNSGTAFHPDVIQYYAGTTVVENMVVYGLAATDTIGAQGLFAGSEIPLKDVAFINCQIVGSAYYVFQFGGPTDHLYVKDSSFASPIGAAWRPTLGFTAHNVVVENSIFSSGPGVVDGVTFR